MLISQGTKVEKMGESDTQLFYQGAVEIAGAARQQLAKLIVVFLIGMLSTVVFFRVYAFETITSQTLGRAEAAGYEVQTSFVNPFEVILLQAKLGIIVGVVLLIPYLFYSARKPLKARGYWPSGKWRSKKRLFLLLIASLVLFAIGVMYAYFVMIPYILQFVSAIAVEAGIRPFFRISKFISFVLAYTLIFGVMAQLPLIMVFTVKSGMVSYTFYREKWKYFVVVGAGISALVTSPDPMTQLIVLGPMLVIYGIGLGVVRVVAADEIRIQQQLKNQDKTAEPKTENVAQATDSQDTHESGEGSSGELMDRGLIEALGSVGNSLRSHFVKLTVIFVAVTGLAFYWLVYYGIAMIRNQTISYMPPELAGQVTTVQLRIFEVVFLVVKYSFIIGVLAILPFLLYYSRHALIKEGIIKGTGSWFYYASRFLLIVALFVGGVLYAYFGMVPVLVSILSNQIVASGMEATFTIGRFVDFVVLLSLLAGITAEMPAAMYILVSSKVVRYDTLKDKWKHFTLVVFTVGAVITSPDPFTMMVVALPLSGFYIVSLGITRVVCHPTIKRVRAERRRLGLVEDGGK